MHHRRIDALVARGEALRERARLVVRVPVERIRSRPGPCAVGRPSAWMSVRNTSSPARFWPPLTMPNSAACLIELVVSPPALARPMILAFDACACSRNDEKSCVLSGCADLAQHLAAVLQHDRFGVALERVAERIVGGQEEPRVAAGLHDRAAGAVGEHPGVVGPVDRVRRARLAGEVGRRGAGDEERLALVLGDLVDGQRHAGVRHVDDDVDLVDVVPLAGDVRADVGLVLVVGRDELDLVAALFDARSPRPPSSRATTEPAPARSV